MCNPMEVEVSITVPVHHLLEFTQPNPGQRMLSHHVQAGTPIGLTRLYPDLFGIPGIKEALDR